MIIDVHTSSHSFPIDNMAHDCRWGKMCAVLDVGFRMGFRFSNDLMGAYMRLPRGIITWGAFVIR